AAADGIIPSATDSGNVRLLRYTQGGAQHVGVAISGDSTTAAASMLGAAWSPLGNAAFVTVHQANATLARAENDPTFDDLHIGDLQHVLGIETTWRIGLDVRDLPPGRVPTHLDLRLASAPNTNRRSIVVFVFWNGTLVRSADMPADGLPQSLAVDIPPDLVATRNEIRVTMQRHLDVGGGCVLLDAGLPAQIMPSSRIVTGTASPSLEAFDGVAARLSNSSSLLLPNDALDHPDRYLPMLVGVGRAFWTGPRSPRPVFYGSSAPALPTGAFILVGSPANTTIDSPVSERSGRLTIRRKDTRDTILDIADMSGWSIAQVVKWNGQVGVQLLPATADGALPSYPEAYGGSDLLLAHGDSSVFPLRTGGVRGPLVINDGPSIWARIKSDEWLWVAFVVLVLFVPIAWSIRAVTRRTPRREVRRSTPVRPPTVPRA
ncbi:MAG TPA: hypothetical protein VHV78_11635, partial [Gemmatimonadaceae bacterium]|nr:hypothetical protein [Gemmatimonadaceae bacterium]